MNIREYKLEDKKTLIEIALRAWEPVFAGVKMSLSPEVHALFVPDWKTQQIQSVNQVCDDAEIEVIVAEGEDAIIGYSAIKSHPDDAIGEVYMIAVDPFYQGKGYGRRLIDESMKIIKAKGYNLVMIETGGDPGHAPARRVYEGMGFEMWPVARYLKKI